MWLKGGSTAYCVTFSREENTSTVTITWLVFHFDLVTWQNLGWDPVVEEWKTSKFQWRTVPLRASASGCFVRPLQALNFLLLGRQISFERGLEKYHWMILQFFSERKFFPLLPEHCVLLVSWNNLCFQMSQLLGGALLWNITATGRVL